MSAFMFVEIMVTDSATYDEYMSLIPPVIAQYGGRYIVRSSRVIPVAGGWSPDRLIVVEFDSLTELTACFQSAEYQALAPLREKSTATRSLIVEQ